jgi:hypothetical protein
MKSDTKKSPIMLWISLSAVFLCGAFLGIREIVSPDIGFHLSTARWILENRALPQTDFLSWTVTDHPYIDLQWIFQLLMYGAEQAGGAAWIAAVTTALTLAVGALMLLRTRRHLGFLPHSSAWLLLLFFLSTLWEPRPHMLSWVYGSLILLILEEYTRGCKKGLPALPVIMLLWVNSHSLFILGTVIIGAYCFSEGIIKRGKACKPLFFWAVAAGLACLLNPYHIKGLLFPLTQFMDIQAVSAYKSTASGIGEFTSPFSVSRYFIEGRFVLFQARLFWQAFTLLSMAGIAAFRKNMRLAEWILFAGFLYIFNSANKNFGYYAMAVFPVACGGLAMIESRLHRKWNHTAAAGCTATAMLVAVLVITGQWYSTLWDDNRCSAGFSNSVLPVEACDFINRHNIRGRILNSWDDGGYIAWTTRQKVFIYSHGEVMGDAFYREYVKAKQPGGFEAALKKYRPEIILVPFKTAPYWLYFLDRQPDWRLVYADAVSALYLHKSVSPEISALPGPMPGVDFPLFDKRAVEQIITQAVTANPIGFSDWLKGSSAWPQKEIKKSSFHLQTAELDACIGISLDGLQKTDFLVPDLLLNLGHAFNVRRLYEWSDACFNAFLRADNDPVIAREIQAVRTERRKR